MQQERTKRSNAYRPKNVKSRLRRANHETGYLGMPVYLLDILLTLRNRDLASVGRNRLPVHTM